MSYRLLFLTSVLLLCSLPVAGQGFSFYEYYSPEDYTVDGVKGHAQNWAAELDTNGYMHFGNGYGLITYNGIDWYGTHIGESGRGISLYRSQSGLLYANGTRDFGTIVPDSINQINYQSIADKFYNPNESIRIWEVYEMGDYLYYRHSVGMAKYHPESGAFRDYRIPEENLSASFQTGGTIIMDGESGLWAFKDSLFSRVPGSELFATQRLLFGMHLTGNTYLLGSTDESQTTQQKSYLWRFDGVNITPFETKARDYLDRHIIYDAVRTDDETIAIATITGGVIFIREDGKLLKIFNERSGLHTNAVYDLFLDHEENLWMGLAEGIQKLHMNGAIQVFSQQVGIEGSVEHISAAGKNVFLYASPNIYVNTTREPEKVTAFEKIPFIGDFGGFVSWKGRVFVYGNDGLYRLYKNGEHRQIFSEPVTELVEIVHEPGVLRFIGQNKLITYNGTSWEVSKLQQTSEIGFAAEYRGELFVTLGTKTRSNSIAKIYKEGLTEVPVEFDTSRIFRIIQLGLINGRLYAGAEGAGSNSGLYEYDPVKAEFRKSEFLSNYPDFQNKQVFRFEQCPNGNVWFFVNKKLLRARQENGEWIVQTSPYKQISKNIIHAIECAEDGVWLGTTGSVFFVSNEEWEYETNFQTNITGMYIRGDSLIYGGYGEPSESFVLPYADNELRFTYAAASYISPEDNTYQVKLEGFDDDWSTWTSETQKDYTNIPEGEYTFRVRSRNVYDVAGVPDAIKFEILPPWYRTWWAYLLYTISIAGMLYLAYKIRINQLMRVQRIRNNIASDLHDEVSATLSSISYFAQAIESDKVTGDKNRFVKLIANSAGDAKEKITDIVWAINPEHDDWQGFLSKCRRFASDLLESKDINYSLKIDEYIPGKLDMQLRQHLWLMYKEMVTNAVRHSGAKNLDVILKYQDGKLKMVIQDDGKGMDVDGVKKGNGLVNIHKRAEQINAEVSLKTSEGFGTRWVLHIPI